MLTRQGVTGLLAGVISLIVGRVFGVVELFVIGAAFITAVLLGLAVVHLRSPRVVASRTIRPTMLVARDDGRVDLRLRHLGAAPSGAFDLIEQVRQPHGAPSTARLRVSPLAPRGTASAGYRVPTAQRGIVTIGPLVAETVDVMGVARKRRTIAGEESVTVAPRAYLIAMPQLGQGVLGRQLLAQARRLGPGEFHSLREYAPGDEPRSIHWRASARSEDLLVKQHTMEGLRRCTVVLDSSIESYRDRDGFERAVTVAASIVHSASHIALSTRMVAPGGIDLRGPEVAFAARRILAEIQLGTAPLGTLERDAAEGLGLVVIVTGSRASRGWRAAQSLFDPTTSALFVLTDEPARESNAVAARTDDEFLNGWRVITGRAGSHDGVRT